MHTRCVFKRFFQLLQGLDTQNRNFGNYQVIIDKYTQLTLKFLASIYFWEVDSKRPVLQFNAVAK